MLVIKTRRIRKIYHGYLSAKELLNFCGKLFRMKRGSQKKENASLEEFFLQQVEEN